MSDVMPTPETPEGHWKEGVNCAYLGDGVYALYFEDRAIIGLTVGNHTNPVVVWVDPSVFVSFANFAKKIWGFVPGTPKEVEPPPPVRASPLAPSSELFNALMTHYGNPTRANPLDSLSKTMQSACRHAGILDEDESAGKPTGILLS